MRESVLKARRIVGPALALPLLFGAGIPAEARTGFESVPPHRADTVPAHAGWELAAGPAEYVPDTLYEILDGGAERYLSYGFLRLTHTRYRLAGDSSASVTLEVFEMGSSLGAFGIYRSGRPYGAEPQSWGAEGYTSGALAAAWKGSVYVRAEADDARPALVTEAGRQVREAVHAAAGDSTLPPLLQALPAAGRAPYSERFEPADLLGHSFLPGGVLATYRLQGREAELFFSDLRSGACAAVEKLRSFQAEAGTVTGLRRPMGACGFRFSDPVLGSGMVIGAERWVAGIHGDLPEDLREELLGELLSRLQSPGFPTDPEPR